jgi:hypothetical protein
VISSLIPFANRWILRPFLNLPRHRLVDECLLGVIRLATGSAAPAAAEYESALLDLKQPDAVEQSSRSTAQGIVRATPDFMWSAGKRSLLLIDVL